MRIIKRKRGKGEYFYLQHSFREKGKVTTKEKYLGIKIPKGIEKIKKDFQRELRSSLYKKLESIKRDFQREWKDLGKESIARLKEDLSITFTYNTNAIEGSTITLEETREIIKEGISPKKPTRDIRETENHNKVFLKMLEQREAISEELILNWHKLIFGETKEDVAGKYREILVRIGDYLAPDWQDVKELMKNLMQDINKIEKTTNPVELAALVHYRFEKIHPFVDGNGRIGRILMNYILWKNNYPMIIIEYKNRKSYNKAFKKDETYFIKYLVSRYLSVHKSRIKKEE